MIIETKYFGQLTIDEATIVDMVQPVYGFENARRYTLISDQELGEAFFWLQAIEEGSTCFILVNPLAFALRVPQQLTPELLELLQVSSIEELDVAYLLNVQDSLENATVNLKSPLVFNPVTKQAAQVILAEDLPLKERLFPVC